jgi:hypothetical protein
MGWPEERKQHKYQPDSFADVYDGTRWQSAVLGDANIAPNGQLGRNVTIGLCGDGVNPFKHKNYSMWPLAMTCFNLPGHLRMTQASRIPFQCGWLQYGNWRLRTDTPTMLCLCWNRSIEIEELHCRHHQQA